MNAKTILSFSLGVLLTILVLSYIQSLKTTQIQNEYQKSLEQYQKEVDSLNNRVNKSDTIYIETQIQASNNATQQIDNNLKTRFNVRYLSDAEADRFYAKYLGYEAEARDTSKRHWRVLDSLTRNTPARAASAIRPVS